MAGPFLTTKIISGDAVAVGSPAQVPCLLACSSVAAPGKCFAFDPGDNPVPTLGAGLVSDALLYLLRRSAQRVVVAIAAATWTAAPSVAHLSATGGSGTGPVVTVALGAGQPGCLDDMPALTLRIATGGPLGTAQGSIAYDGGSGVEDFTLPVEGPAVLRGTMDISLGASISGQTLLWSAPAVETVTFSTGSLVAAPAGLKAATATVASIVTLGPSDLLVAGLAALAAHPRRLTFLTAGGTPADAPATVSITGTFPDGTAASEVLILSQTAGAVTSGATYASIVSIVYAAADGTGATIAIGYFDAHASPAEIVADFNAGAIAAPLDVRARAAQTGTGTYLELYSVFTGMSITETINPSSSADFPALGFTSGAGNLTATGTAATYPLPTVGLVLTFPVGTYIVNESYVMIAVGPRASVSALKNAAIAAHDQFAINPFGFLMTAQPSDSAGNAVTLVATFETLRAAWLADPNTPRDVYFGVGGPWHTASSVTATNATNITTNDNALVSAFSTAAASANSVAVDDVYFPGSAFLAPGFFRRSAVLAWAVKRASANRIAATVAEGIVPDATLTGGDGLTMARDQNSAVVHIEGLDGPGFFALKSAADDGSVKFALGATRAGKTSRLRHDGDFAVCCETARLAQAIVKPWEGQRPGVNSLTGQMVDSDRNSRAGQVDAGIRPTLLPDDGIGNCSDFGVVINDPSTGLFVDNGIAPVVITIFVLGTIQQVQLTISATGVTTIGSAP